MLRQIREMTRLLEDRRSFRQMVIDNARKDPKKVEQERKIMNMVLDEIDDINQQIDLGKLFCVVTQITNRLLASIKRSINVFFGWLF